MNHNCAVCSNKTVKKSDKKGRIFHFCGHCRFISLDASFHLNSEEEKKRYDLHNNNIENDGYRKWLQMFINTAVKPYVDEGASILDFGSGPDPVLSKLLQSEGFHVDIFDKYFHDAEYSGSYDMITSTEVFEHLDHPVSVLKQLKKSLKRGGFLSIKTAFRPEKDEDFLKWWYKEDTTHISFFSKETFLYISSLIEVKLHYCDNISLIIYRN